MIVKLNHLQGKAAATSAQDVIGTVYALLEEGHIEKSQFARLQIELDWIQYKQNFREVVIATHGYNQSGQQVPIMDVHVDVRQVVPGCLRAALLRALAHSNAPEPQNQDRLPLEDFKSMRSSIVWDFNKLYWSRLHDWELATGKGYEQALPGGASDGHNPEAIADSVADFWTLLRDLESKNQLPPEIYLLEIGVGTGVRCGMWLTKFRALDQERGTDYYPKLRVLLGDYSLATLDMSKPAVEDHADLCSFLVLDAMNPLKTLSFLRHKIMQVHSTNVYDNLPDEEVVRRDGKLYFVQVRAYLPDGRRGAALHRVRRSAGQAALHGRTVCSRATPNSWAIRPAAWRFGWISGARFGWKSAWCWWRICPTSLFRRAWTRRRWRTF